jgi:hypothetical protein
LDRGVFYCVSGECFGCYDAPDAGERFDAGFGFGCTDVDRDSRVVYYDVFGVAGLDAGYCYDGGVVSGGGVVLADFLS